MSLAQTSTKSVLRNIGHVAADNCLSGADALARAESARATRKQWRAPVLSELKTVPIVPEPTPSLARELQLAEMGRIINCVTAKFEISRETMLQTVGDKGATGALLISSALCVRRLNMTRAEICDEFGIIDALLVRALNNLDEVFAREAMTKFSDLDRVVTRLHDEWLSGINEPPRYTVDEIIRAVASVSGVFATDIKSSRRTANVVLPRQLGMALVKHLTLRSLPEIGRRFGGRDHTTALWAIRKMEPVIAAVAPRMAPDATAVDWAAAAFKEACDNPPKRRKHPPKLVTL